VTVRTKPGPDADEKTGLTQFLDFQRATLVMKTEGLDRQQLNQRIETSPLTFGAGSCCT
jgi:hypothetical protein